MELVEVPTGAAPWASSQKARAPALTILDPAQGGISPASKGRSLFGAAAVTLRVNIFVVAIVGAALVDVLMVVGGGGC